MNRPKLYRRCFIAISFICAVTVSGCYNSRHMNKYVADHYDNEIPGAGKSKHPEITIASALPGQTENISTATHTVSVLPLLVYWVINDRLNCTLNPKIAFNNFSKTVQSQAGKDLVKKLNGRKLDLTLEQAPLSFSVDDKLHDVLLIIHWEKVFIEPEIKDMVVSYKITDGSNEVKSGRVTVTDEQKNNNFRFFQSIPSGTSEYLDAYTDHITAMSKKAVEEISSKL